MVVSHRATDRLVRCLESIASQGSGPGTVETVIVDSASPGHSASRIAQRFGARVVRLEEHQGVPAGANAGARAARGDIFAFLSDDARAGEGWLASAASALEDPTVAGVAPKVLREGRFLEIVLDETGSSRSSAGRRRLVSATLAGRDMLPYLLGAGVGPMETTGRGGVLRGGPDVPSRWRWTRGGRRPFYVPLPPGAGRVELALNGEAVRPARVVDLLSTVGCYLRDDGVIGDIGSNVVDEEEFDTWEERFGLSRTALVTTRDAFVRIGPFVTRYVASYEDSDWCWRAQLLGYRLLFDPSVSVRHARAAASGGVLSNRLRYLFERNRLLTLVRNAPGGMAARELWRKWRAPSDDGVAEVIPRFLPRAVAERGVLSRSWVLSPREVCERWAGVDVPLEPV